MDGFPVMHNIAGDTGGEMIGLDFATLAIRYGKVCRDAKLASFGVCAKIGVEGAILLDGDYYMVYGVEVGIFRDRPGIIRSARSQSPTDCPERAEGAQGSARRL